MVLTISSKSEHRFGKTSTVPLATKDRRARGMCNGCPYHDGEQLFRRWPHPWPLHLFLTATWPPSATACQVHHPSVRATSRIWGSRERARGRLGPRTEMSGSRPGEAGVELELAKPAEWPFHVRARGLGSRRSQALAAAG